jgi:hypothetical protein
VCRSAQTLVLSHSVSVSSYPSEYSSLVHVGANFAWNLFVCLFVCYFVCLFVCLLLCLFVTLFVRLFVCLLLCLFVTLFVRLFVCLFVFMLLCLFVCLFVCYFVCYFVCLFVCLFVTLFVCLPLRRRRSTVPAAQPRPSTRRLVTHARVRCRLPAVREGAQVRASAVGATRHVRRTTNNTQTAPLLGAAPQRAAVATRSASCCNAQRRCNERNGRPPRRRCNARDGRAVVAAAVVRQHDGLLERGLEKAEVRCAPRARMTIKKTL